MSLSSNSPGPPSSPTPSAPTPISLPTPSAPTPISLPTPTGEGEALGPPDASTSALSAALDESILTDIDSGAAQLLSTAAPDGLSDPFNSAQGGWIVGSQEVDPYTNVAVASGTLNPFVGQEVDPYTNVAADGANPNAFTGDQNVDPFTGSGAVIVPGKVELAPDDLTPGQHYQQQSLTPYDTASSLALSGQSAIPSFIQASPVEPDTARKLTPDEMAALVAKYAQYDAELAASQGAGGSAAPSSTGAPTASSPMGTHLPPSGGPAFPPDTTVAGRSMAAYLANEAASAGIVRALDALRKSRLGITVNALLEQETILDNIQRISQAASSYRQIIRTSDQSRGGVLNRAVSPLLDRNSSKTWTDFVRERLQGRIGEQALEDAYVKVAQKSAAGRSSANVLGLGSRVFGGALGLGGAGASGYAFQDDLSRGQWFDATVDATSFASSGLAFGGALAGSVALTEGGLVLGSFGIGVLIGTGIDKGIEWATEGLFGVDLSPSGIIAWGLTALDSSLTSLWIDASKPAYTQTIGWKLLQWIE
jgi:hypothetical protein